jgi:hypothetical protein
MSSFLVTGMAILLIVIFASSSINAQTKRERLESKQRIDQMVNMLKKELSLSKEQAAQVKEIVADNLKNAEQERGSFDGDSDARIKARMERMIAMDKKIESIFNKEQKVKYEEYKKERAQRSQQMRQRQNERNPR